ncbi:hypothetical protein [Nocardia brevicatena]|uniref:hypothetical protein n=1 Tax=Nocardia brevicatena TaxID=37327 RepID=UPI0003043F1E|nr:hypothetical protein [Nocardia brevicatena]
MEMTLVGVGETSDALRRVSERLAENDWTVVRVHDVVAGPVGESGVLDALSGFAARPEVVETLELDRLIADNPGGQVLVLCEPACVREMTARILEVPTELVPLPESGSVTRFRAARSEVRTVVCVNDTLHLVDTAAVPDLERMY